MQTRNAAFHGVADAFHKLLSGNRGTISVVLG